MRVPDQEDMESITKSRAQSPTRDYSLQDCIDWVYLRYPDQCTPPAMPAQVKTLALTALNAVPSTSSSHKSLPLLEAITSLYNKIDKEILRTETGQSALTAGKYPWLKPTC